MTIEIRYQHVAGATAVGRVVGWLKREGQVVRVGEPLVEVETDKTIVEIETPDTGILQRILVAADTEVADGALLAILEAVKQPEAVDDDSAAAAVEPRGAVVGPPATTVPDTNDHPRSSLPGSPAIARSAVAREQYRATPLATKMAEIAGLDLVNVSSGPGGAIGKREIELALQMTVLERGIATDTAASSAAAPPAPEGSFSARYDGPFRDVPLTPIRRVTARRLQYAKQTAPHFYLTADCRVDKLVGIRERLNTEGRNGRISITDLLVFVVARALKRVPEANAAWVGTAIRIFERVDLAVAVSTSHGLLTPVVAGADSKSLGTISKELTAMIARARAGTITAGDSTGGTFTLSNLGMYSVTSITPIINPPHVCTLGIGAIETRSVVDSGTVVPGRVMSCTLSADHRALDGAAGADFLASLRRMVEDPLSVVLDF